MARKKKEEIDPYILDPNELRKKTVVYGLLGRALASHGAVLTNLEKGTRDLLYLSFKIGRKPNEDPVFRAELDKDPREGVKKYTPAKALDMLKKEYPKAAERFISILNETHNDPRPQLIYGLLEGKEIDSEYAIQTLKETLGITRGPARQLYEKIIAPKIRKNREENDLVYITMKE